MTENSWNNPEFKHVVKNRFDSLARKERIECQCALIRLNLGVGQAQDFKLWQKISLTQIRPKPGELTVLIHFLHADLVPKESDPNKEFDLKIYDEDEVDTLRDLVRAMQEVK